MAAMKDFTLCSSKRLVLHQLYEGLYVGIADTCGPSSYIWRGFRSRIIRHIPFIQIMKRIQLKNHPAYPLHSAYEEDSVQKSAYISPSFSLWRGFNSRIILHIPFIQPMKRIQLNNHPTYPLHPPYEEDSVQETGCISSSFILWRGFCPTFWTPFSSHPN